MAIFNKVVEPKEPKLIESDDAKEGNLAEKQQATKPLRKDDKEGLEAGC